MELFGFKTVDSLPCLYHPELNLLVLSDLHLGLEGSMTFDGGYVPQFQLEEIMKDIKKAKEITDAEHILLNGDLKHEFKFTRFAEKDEIEEFTDFILMYFDKVTVVKGNHDTFLEDIFNTRNVEFVDSYLEDEVLFIHGHSALKNIEGDYKTVVIGHEHPALELKDEIGVTEKVDCFLYGKTKNEKNIIVLPAFSKISGGSAVNIMPQNKLLSPVLRNEVDSKELKALAVSREAGLFEFPEIGKII